MERRIDVITLAVTDLERALAFYRDGLGLESRSVTATQYAGDDTTPAGAIVMFRLDGGLLLNLYPRSELAKNAQIPRGPAQSGEFSLGHIVASRTDVDAVLAQAEAAGATITDEPTTVPGAFTPATSATLTDTFGKSSTTLQVLAAATSNARHVATRCERCSPAPLLHTP